MVIINAIFTIYLPVAADDNDGLVVLVSLDAQSNEQHCHCYRHNKPHNHHGNLIPTTIVEMGSLYHDNDNDTIVDNVDFII